MYINTYLCALVKHKYNITRSTPLFMQQEKKKVHHGIYKTISSERRKSKRLRN